jgi:hypothetical protein
MADGVWKRAVNIVWSGTRPHTLGRLLETVGKGLEIISRWLFVFLFLVTPPSPSDSESTPPFHPHWQQALAWSFALALAWAFVWVLGVWTFCSSIE